VILGKAGRCNNCGIQLDCSDERLQCLDCPTTTTSSVNAHLVAEGKDDGCLHATICSSCNDDGTLRWPSCHNNTHIVVREDETGDHLRRQIR
jgi:hypothetical protein